MTPLLIAVVAVDVAVGLAFMWRGVVATGVATTRVSLLVYAVVLGSFAVIWYASPWSWIFSAIAALACFLVSLLVVALVAKLLRKGA